MTTLNKLIINLIEHLPNGNHDKPVYIYYNGEYIRIELGGVSTFGGDGTVIMVNSLEDQRNEKSNT